MPAERRGRVQVLLAVLRFFLARRCVDFPSVADEAQQLFALTEAADAVHLGLSEDLRAAAFISLGIAEVWAFRFADAERHLKQGVAGAPDRAAILEFIGLTHGAHGMLLFWPSAASGVEQAGDRAGGTAWLGEEPLAG